MSAEAPSNRRLLSLVELATNKIVQNISKINDTGATPFHLLAPVLERMNAKQLGQIESTSPQITPESDKLWYILIEKDFPNRPLPTRKAIDSDEMPNRTLYHKYLDDMESFRNDSAQRLRRITEKLRKEKSANKIVKVQELLKDPTVKRKSWSNTAGSFNRYNAPAIRGNSILSKARRDMQNRSIMFPQKLNRFDPYDAFKSNRTETINARRPKPSRVTSFNSSAATSLINRNSAGIYQALPCGNSRTTRVVTSSPQRSSGMARSVDNIRNCSPTNSSSSSNVTTTNVRSTEMDRATSESPASSPQRNQSSDKPKLDNSRYNESLQERKKRPPPSIFLTSKRIKPSEKRPRPKTPPAEVPRPSKIKAIRSSIFN